MSHGSIDRKANNVWTYFKNSETIDMKIKRKIFGNICKIYDYEYSVDVLGIN